MLRGVVNETQEQMEVMDEVRLGRNSTIALCASCKNGRRSHNMPLHPNLSTGHSLYYLLHVAVTCSTGMFSRSSCRTGRGQDLLL